MNLETLHLSRLVSIDDVGQVGEKSPIQPGDLVKLTLRMSETKWKRPQHGLMVSTYSDEHGEALAVVLWQQVEQVTFVLPSINRTTFAPMLAPQLVSIQPMTLPANAIFYMDYTYDSGSKEP